MLRDSSKIATPIFEKSASPLQELGCQARCAAGFSDERRIKPLTPILMWLPGHTPVLISDLPRLTSKNPALASRIDWIDIPPLGLVFSESRRINFLVVSSHALRACCGTPQKLPRRYSKNPRRRYKSLVAKLVTPQTFSTSVASVVSSGCRRMGSISPILI